MNDKPWDARLACHLVQPFQDGPFKPNHFTTLRLLTGLAGIVLIASGKAINSGAWLVVISNFLDHTDGELARLSGHMTRFGHYYDLSCDALITVGIFVAFGLGVRGGSGSELSIVLGTVAGLVIAAIFYMRHEMEQAEGKSAVQQARMAGFEAEDILYLLPLVTYTEVIYEFLMLAAVGAPIACIWVARQFLEFRERQRRDGLK